MATKRAADELEGGPARPRSSSKRTKLSPTVEAKSDSSAPSSCSVSEDSALRSSPPRSGYARHSSASSLELYMFDDVSTASLESSELGTGPEDDRGTHEDNEEIVNIGGSRKPDMTQRLALEGSEDLRSRLDALLPRLAAANRMLAEEEHPRTLEDVDEDEEHIEMNLGLGVLEEKGEGEDGSDSENEDDSDESDSIADGENAQLQSDAVPGPRDDQDTDVLRRLLKQPKPRRKMAIEVLGSDDGQGYL